MFGLFSKMSKANKLNKAIAGMEESIARDYNAYATKQIVRDGFTNTLIHYKGLQKEGK